ncbi:MAG TPA: FAD-dependent oxidoreductase [Rhodanobacteraceae bacterium]|nr:FAD-dependent oxidoreductase [Rhodanobacteraceae bacterium]
MAADTPAVVLGAGLNGLGVARSLARARIPVWLLDSDERRAEMHTRAAKPLKIGALHGDALVEELVCLGTTRFAGVRPILLLTQEESVKTVSQHRERLLAHYRFSLPSTEIVEALQHKHGFQRLAEQHNAPIPALVHVQSPADLFALESLRYPVVIKPGERHAEYGRQFKKAYCVENAAEANELVRRILPVMSDVVAQEWIEGPDSNIYFCLQCLDRQRRVVVSFTGRKVRSWPPHVGGTASCMPAPEAHAKLSDLTTRFFQSVDMVGMAGMEYKRDSRSGEFRMVEPTIGRTDYQAEIATLNGVNLPYAAYCTELGTPFPDSTQAKRRLAWRVRSEDEQSAAAQNMPSGKGFDGASGVCDALWRRNDPMPYLVQNLQRIGRALHARTARMKPGSQMLRSKP